MPRAGTRRDMEVMCVDRGAVENRASFQMPMEASSAETSEDLGCLSAAHDTTPVVSSIHDTSGLLRILEDTMDDLRGLVTCRVCVRPMYEPYTIACGHTFCYSCLAQWFWNHKRNKTCPDCRAPVRRQPAPAYVVRQMADIFISRVEIMPIGETTHDHAIAKEEEADIVETDRLNPNPINGGLFRGCFRPQEVRTREIIYDHEDGVNRCPNCAWELELGYCQHCQMTFNTDSEAHSGFDGSDLSESELYYDGQSLGGLQGTEDNDDWASQADHDDVSVDGDRYSVHTYENTGDLSFGRAAAQGLIGHRIRQDIDIPTSRRHSQDEPGMLSDVVTNDEREGFGDLDEDSDDEQTSLDGFSAGDNEDESGCINLTHSSSDSGSDSGSTTRVQPARSRAKNGSDDEIGEFWVDSYSTLSQSNSMGREDVGDNSPRSISISSDSELLVPAQRSRKRRRIVHDISSDSDSTQEWASNNTRPTRRFGNIGSATVDRRLPEPGSTDAVLEQGQRQSRILRSPLRHQRESPEANSDQATHRSLSSSSAAVSSRRINSHGNERSNQSRVNRNRAHPQPRSSQRPAQRVPMFTPEFGRDVRSSHPILRGGGFSRSRMPDVSPSHWYGTEARNIWSELNESQYAKSGPQIPPDVDFDDTHYG